MHSQNYVPKTSTKNCWQFQILYFKFPYAAVMKNVGEKFATFLRHPSSVIV